MQTGSFILFSVRVCRTNTENTCRLRYVYCTDPWIHTSPLHPWTSVQREFSPASQMKGHWKDWEPYSSVHSGQLCNVLDKWKNIMNSWNCTFPYLYMQILSIKKSRNFKLTCSSYTLLPSHDYSVPVMGLKVDPEISPLNPHVELVGGSS